MAINTRTIIALAISGWAAFKVTQAIRSHSQQRENRHQKTQLHTWEGEGGNLPPYSSSQQEAQIPTPKPTTH
jgi:hypothetical protein